MFTVMRHSSLVRSLLILCLVKYSYGQQCDQIPDVARIDCYPEDAPTQEKCEARNCCWRSPTKQSNFNDLKDPSVPICYHPSDFPTYEVTSNQSTDFGQRLEIVKSQKTYMPNDILKLTVDLIYETQQRLRLKIYDPSYQRYEVPLEVPVVTKRADTTDYDVVVKFKPFSILVTRKSTGATL